jgi:fermentation-respiration switch protein FrsA (DUF1100 family)
VSGVRFDAETRAEDGVRERSFVFDEGGERVPGLLWLPPRGGGPRPLVLAGHGLGLDKRHPFPAPSLRALVAERGCALAILDAPGHGDRRADPRQDFDATAADYRRHWSSHAGSRIAREYAAAARWLREEPEIGDGPLGYWGLSLATQYGLAYLAEDASVRAAVVGLFGRGRVVARYAARVRCPVFFILQLDDEIHPRAAVEALFEDIAAPEKRLAASPGAHVDVPGYVCRASVDFLLRSLARG